MITKQQYQIDQKQIALNYFKEKAEKLERNLENTKIFLNMVIHDLRSPTTQVQYQVKEALDNLKSIVQDPSVKASLNQQ